MKKRLDDYLVEIGEAESRSKAQALIMAGEVLVNEVVIGKKAHPIDTEKDTIRVRDRMPFVSRGGEKLEAALEAFDINCSGRICLDIGSSTGGFTDCLLQRGAFKVYDIDSGRDQLAWKIRTDSRVEVYEKTNARFLEKLKLSPLPDLIVTDVSFISVTKIAPSVLKAVPNFKEWIILIKPQFEAEKHEIGKGGIIRVSQIRDEIVSRFISKMNEEGFVMEDKITSPIKGAKGNIEYLGLFKKKSVF